MLRDWIHWLFSMEFEDQVALMLPFLMLDVPRYVLMGIFVWFLHRCRALWRWLTGVSLRPRYDYAPSVCILIVGHNEVSTIQKTLSSVADVYPDLQIIVVDDGSTDGMAEMAQEFSRRQAGVTVLARPERGGKSSGLNFALPFVRAEIIVCLDADSYVARDAIWELLQPMQDPNVAGVSGNLIVRNPEVSTAASLQALEYRRSIFLGRMISDQLGILGIISGAIGAYRTSAVRRVQGWDVGPGEDGDLALRLRKLGYQIRFAPFADCFTKVPTSWYRLFRQRRRWDWAIVTFECRKHIDLINPLASNFCWSNAVLILERWTFSLVLQLMFWIYMVWWLLHWPFWQVAYSMFLFLIGYWIADVLLMAAILDMSTDRRRDLGYLPWLPLMPLYHLFLRFTTTYAVLEELFTRRSFRDDFVPAKVRNVTWHW